MWKSKRTFVGLLIFSLASCTSARNTETTWENKELGSFPYHPVVYHLDLCALSYQLYAQTLVWPFDPYYEEMSNWDYDRTKYMRKVRDWADEQGAEQVRAKAGLGAYRGPGTLGGYDANENHDPLLFRYDRLHPWVPSYTNPSTKAWDVVKAPDRITDRIGDLFVCYRTTAGAPGDVSLEPLPPKGDDRKPDAPDVLLAFEGGTGAKGDAGRPTSQSLMGFVLLRTKDTGGYDLHVVFRASRSGSLFRALTQAAKHKEEGNPDWITDLGYNQLDPQSGAPISTVGTVSRGFAHAMIAILPQLFGCLEKVSEIRKGAAPDQIYVTGHSLGGALTQHFVSAVLLGNRYGPGGSGPAMPAALKPWPWKRIKMITFSSPRAGNEEWARTLTVEGLQVDFFSTKVALQDEHALAPDEEVIVGRLLDANRPAGFRVLITQDPATTEKVIGGKHVGKSVYVNTKGLMSYVPRAKAHEPSFIRELVVEAVEDSRTPLANPWAKEPEKQLNAGRGNRGMTAELTRLADAYKKYFQTRDLWFDEAGFDRDLALRFAIDQRE
ncbi:MAG: lipase family protein [Planctomycetota bacterium]|jgi:hypothetical protein